MQKGNLYLKNYLHLHLIVFIWGFTAVLGKLITLSALDLVWFRMAFAVVLMFLFVVFTKKKMQVPKKVFLGFVIAGIVIALHWFTFYQSIKVSNISITLACLSTGAFFASLIEPIYFRKKIIWLDVLFGLIAIIGLLIIFKVEKKYTLGIVLGIITAFLSALFSVINSNYAKRYEPSVISFYELAAGLVFLSIYMLFDATFTKDFFILTTSDFIWLFLLSSICTAYAFSASVKVMQYLSSFTVMLTVNLEPIYGIILAILIFKESEKMEPMFYLGAILILATVLLNGIIKNSKKMNRF